MTSFLDFYCNYFTPMLVNLPLGGSRPQSA